MRFTNFCWRNYHIFQTIRCTKILEGKLRGKICAFEAEINKYLTKLGSGMMFVLVIEL